MYAKFTRDGRPVFVQAARVQSVDGDPAGLGSRISYSGEGVEHVDEPPAEVVAALEAVERPTPTGPQGWQSEVLQRALATDARGLVAAPAGAPQVGHVSTAGHVARAGRVAVVGHAATTRPDPEGVHQQDLPRRRG